MKFDILRYRALAGGISFLAGCSALLIIVVFLSFAVQDNPSDSFYVPALAAGELTWVAFFFFLVVPAIARRIRWARVVVWVSIVLSTVLIPIFLKFLSDFSRGLNVIG